MTPREYDYALRGYLKGKGIDPDAKGAVAFTKSRLDELMKAYPDG